MTISMPTIFEKVLLTFCVAFVFFMLIPASASAWYCGGGVTCCSREETVYSPSGCDPKCSWLDPTCTRCTSSTKKCTDYSGSGPCGGAGGGNQDGSGCNDNCNGIVLSGSCSSGGTPTYPPPPPPPPPLPPPTPENPNPSPVPLYTCSGTSCVATTGTTGWADNTCGNTCNIIVDPCIPGVDCPCTDGSCDPPQCDDKEGIGTNAYIVGGRLIQPGETLTWTTHQPGGGATADRATRITSSSPNAGGYSPDTWSSFTCPGDAVCAIARMQGAYYHVEGFEAQIMDTQRYCYSRMVGNDEVSTKTCKRREDCNYPDWDCQSERPPKWHFFFGPRNSTYILSNAEFRVAQDYAWSDVLGKDANGNNIVLWSWTDISGFGKRIPFSSFQLPWANCASLIMRPSGCGPRVAGSPASGNYFEMERDLYRVTQPPPDFWCIGKKDVCRFNDKGWLYGEKDNPLAGGSWWKEAVIQIPLKYMSPGTNTINIRVSGDPAQATYKRQKKCLKGSFVYYNDPSVVDKRLAQASCSNINFENQESAQFPQVFINQPNRISGTFSPAVEVYPLNPDSISVNKNDWTAHGATPPPVIGQHICADASCGSMLGETLLRVTPQTNEALQFIRSKYVELSKQPEGGRYSLVFSTRKVGNADPSILKNVVLERYPNYFRKPLDIFSHPVNDGRHVASYQPAILGYFQNHLDSTFSPETTVSNQWTNRQVIFNVPPEPAYSGADGWIRDHTKSSTKVRFTLRLLGLLSNQAVDYANVQLTSNPIPESVTMYIKKLPALPAGVSETLKDSSGNWVNNAEIRNHFSTSTGWIRIGGWNDGTPVSGWSAQTPKSSLHEATWTVPSTLTPGKYLLVPNINHGYNPADGETKLACTGNPYPNNPAAWADCSQNCGKVIELVECFTDKPAAPVLSRGGDGTYTELSKASLTPSLITPDYQFYNSNHYYKLYLTARVPEASYIANVSKVEMVVYPRTDNISLPDDAGAIDPSLLPATATYVPPSGFTASGRAFSTQIDASKTLGPFLTVALRTLNDTCGTYRSGWIYYHIDLTTSLEGGVRVSGQTNQQCDTTYSAFPTDQDLQLFINQTIPAGLTYTTPINSFTTGSFRVFLGGSFWLSGSVTQSPLFHPWHWNTASRMTTIGLVLPPRSADSEEAFVCSPIVHTVDGSSRCLLKSNNYTSGLSSPRSNAPEAFQFCLIKGILMHDSWWQTRGGLVFSHGNATLKPPIKPAAGLTPPARSSKCDPDVCQPFVVARRLGVDPVAATQTIDAHTSSGFLISNANLNPSSPYSGFLSQSTVGGGAMAKNAGISTQPTESENYDSFWKKIDQSRNVKSITGSALAAATTTLIQFINNDLPENIYTQEGLVITKVARISGDMTLRLNENPGGEGPKGITVSQNKRVIVFVEGNLTVTGTPTTTTPTQHTLITLSNNASIFFIVGGSITFHQNLGFDNLAITDPLVVGIFYADKQLIVAGNGGLTPNDKKFVGAGSFIGREGVQLNRKYDSTEILSKEKNAASPVEMFIHRPDLVLNTPSILMTTMTTWQEVN